MVGVAKASGATSRRVASAVTLASALGATAAPIAHIVFQVLNTEVSGGELRVEEREDVLEGCRAPRKAVSR